MVEQDISERLLDFSVRALKLVDRINTTAVGRHVGNQLMRSGTSAGAHYEEACGAVSKPDFVHRMQVTLKELRESVYWLKLLKKAELLAEKDIFPILQEADELVRIVGKSVVTAKSRGK